MKNINKYVILSTMLLQSVVIIVFTIQIYNIVPQIALKSVIPFFNILVAITTILMLVSLKKLSYYEKKEAELELMKVNMKNIEQLINLVYTQKHNYLTHIQSIGALVYLEEYEELSEYLKGISKDYRFSGSIVSLGYPALTALINAKREVAREKKISFHIKCKFQIYNIEVPTWDLCCLFSNILENAVEAASIIKGRKWIKVTIDYCDNNYIFRIENTGKIEENIMNDLYKQGNTSKSSPGRGYGLYICKKIVDKYKGTINIKNMTYGTVVSEITLPGEVDNYDKKVS